MSGGLEWCHSYQDSIGRFGGNTYVSSCGGSDRNVWLEAGASLVDTAVPFIFAALASPSGSAAGGASGPTATIAGHIQTGLQVCTEFDTAKSAYDTCQSELNDLEARKAHVDSLDTGSLSDMSAYTSDNNYTGYVNLQKVLKGFDSRISQAQTYAQEISMYDAQINTSGLSETGRAAVGQINNNESVPKAVGAINGATYPEASNGGVNQTKSNDLKIAQQIDAAIIDRQTAKNRLLGVFTSINEVFPANSGVNVPEVSIDSKPEDILSALDQLKTNVQAKINGLGTIKIGPDGNKKTVSDVYNGVQVYKHAVADKNLTGNNTLDNQIQSKKAELTKNKTAVEAKEADLTAAKTLLTNARTLIMSVVDNKREYEQANADLTAAKHATKQGRNLWQRLWGRNRNEDAQRALRDAETTRRNEKNEYNSATAALQNSYADASVGMLSVVDSQLLEINKRLNEIAQIKNEQIT